MVSSGSRRALPGEGIIVAGKALQRLLLKMGDLLALLDELRLDHRGGVLEPALVASRRAVSRSPPYTSAAVALAPLPAPPREAIAEDEWS